ncbi:MAG: IPT/TIG domain-containing protein, partial [Acidobacteriota bacterium]|nr:IPT/TIG domain-containing protein [Acidobacteriota bacterium]
MFAVLIGFLGVIGQAQLTPARPPARPTLTSFSPSQGAPGTSVTITFTGTNFVANALGLQFAPAQGLTVGRPQFVSPTQVSVPVQIDASAQPGSRQVLLMVGDRPLPAASPFTITSPATPNCPPGIAACGPARSPTLLSFAPLQGTQGTMVTLMLSGSNLAAPAALLFTPSSGLTVQSTTVVNPGQIQAQLTIAPDASLGPRGVAVVAGKTRLSASNTFTVVAGAPAGRMPMQILRIVPNQVSAGSQNVDLTLQGTNFVPGTQVTFTMGAGIPANIFAMGPARYVNSTELHVMVNVLPSALPGGRDVNLQTPNQQTATGRGMLNVLAPQTRVVAQPSAPKIAPILLQTFTKGVIKLDGPQWGDVFQGEITYHYGIPLLDDDAVFRWHEQNPGLANYYELRIYAKDGKTLLVTKRIDRSALFSGSPILVAPTYYRPDAAFLMDFLSKSPKVPSVGFVYASLSTTHPKPGQETVYLPPPGGSGPQLSDGDMQWEVAGFHTYNKNGVAPQQPPQGTANGPQSSSGGSSQSGGTTDLEVEISDRWPLSAPMKPTGLQCNGSGTGAGLQVNSVADKQVYDANGKPVPGQIDPIDYVGDPWVLSGNLDLSRSPYAAHPNLHQLPGSRCDGCLFGQIDQVQFDNVFVDWGDGSVQPLSAPPKDANMTNWGRGELLTLPSNATSPGSVQHAYQYPGSFTVRVFQLSEADAQHTNVSLVAASVDGPGIHSFMQAAVLSNALNSGGGNLSQASLQSSFQRILARGSGALAQGPTPSQVAGDAYMFVCHPLTITVPEDLAADGPLHLMSIDDPDFPGYDVRAPGASAPRIPVRGSVIGPPAGGTSSAQLLLTGVSQQRPQEAMQRTPSGPAAICSTCDDGISARTYLHYYGRGQVKVTWEVNGVQSPQTLPIGPSERRTGLRRQGPTPQSQPPIKISKSDPLKSSALQLQPLGQHAVIVEADVVPQPSNPNLSIAVGQALGGLMSPGGASQALSGSGVAQAQSLLNTLAPPPGSNLPPLKVGVLSPMQHSAGGMGAVQYLNGPLQQIVSGAANALPDQHVTSNAKQYEVVEADPKQPCKFLFAVRSGGTFEIDGLQNHVTRNGTKYSGTGNLIIHLANSSNGGYDLYSGIPVKIDNWEVADGEHVDTGAINVAPQLTLAASAPGLKGTIDRIQGQAKGEIDATISVGLSDNTLRLPGVEKPPTWNGVTSELHANGDWIKDGLTMPATIIGWSAFRMQSSSVSLDLSHAGGDAGGPLCGPLTGAQWVGVRFRDLTVTPYTMDLVSSSALQPKVVDWGILGSGLCGSLSTGPFSARLGDGSVSFASINARASNGDFSAQY